MRRADSCDGSRDHRSLSVCGHGWRFIAHHRDGRYRDGDLPALHARFWHMLNAYGLECQGHQGQGDNRQCQHI
jgi:hypothetical protein